MTQRELPMTNWNVTLQSYERLRKETDINDGRRREGHKMICFRMSFCCTSLQLFVRKFKYNSRLYTYQEPVVQARFQRACRVTSNASPTKSGGTSFHWWLQPRFRRPHISIYRLLFFKASNNSLRLITESYSAWPLHALVARVLPNPF